MRKIYFSLFALLFLSVSAFAVKHTVTVNFNNFSPGNVNANVGDTIHWVWGAGFHTTTSTVVPGGAATWNAPIDNVNNTFDYRITVAGAYTYICSPHGFQGTINAVANCSAQAVGSTLNCFGNCNGIATAFPQGQQPFTYSWNTNPVQNTAIASNLCAGTYTVTITDATGCVATAQATVTQPQQITVTSQKTNVSCFGACNGSATVSAQGGVGNFTYTWNPNVGNTATVNNLCAGTYICTVKDGNNCSVQHTVQITQPNALSIAFNSNNPPCGGVCNGFATALVQGGTPPYTYSWNTNPPQTSQTAQALCAGTYVCSVTDANGCTIQGSVTLTSPAAIVLSTSSTPASCGASDGSVSVQVVSGGVQPFTYSWNTNPVQNTATATNVPAGAYTVTVTDGSGCTQTAMATVANPNGPTVTITQQSNVTCFGLCNGAASSNATGGAAPYTFQWSDGQITQSANNLCAGVYTITVTDASGCAGTAQVTITEPPALMVTPSQINPTCAGACDALAVANVQGGTPPYTYSWNTNPPQNTQGAGNLCAGIYICTVTDANSCTQLLTVNITDPAAISGVSTQQNASCDGICNGMATVQPTGGTPPYSFQWNTNPPQSNATATGLCAGTYICDIKDGSGCTGSVTVTITNMVTITISGSATAPTCQGCTDGTATATPSGGNAPYAYSWNTNPPQTTQTATNLAAGNYYVCVTDAGGCTSCDSVAVPQGPNAISDQGGNTASVTIYPNPAKGIFNVALKATGAVELSVSNVLGQVIYTEKVTGQDNLLLKAINISESPRGIYFLKVDAAGGSKTYKLILE